jgi:predicted N-acetyltransferase YhbS
MIMELRQYNHREDYDRVGQFLIDTYQSGDFFLNWLQPRWEYMHYHPYINNLDLTKIGVVEENNEILGVANFEHQPSQVYLHVHPHYPELKELLVDYAERTFRGPSSRDEREHLVIFVNGEDSKLESIVKDRGFEKHASYSETHSRIGPNDPIQEIDLHEGFAIQSLEDENDLSKINQVLWRGFNHEGPPPEEEIPSRRQMQSAPNFVKDLNIVVVAPEGHYVSYSGIWYVAQNRVAYVEPVATDPDYRRMGLGKAAVLECARRARKMGAEDIWVGSGQAFYLAIGFTKMFDVNPWVKYYDTEPNT